MLIFTSSLQDGEMSKRNQIKSVYDLERLNYIQEIKTTNYPDFGVFYGGSKRRKQKTIHRKKISRRRKNKTNKKKCKNLTSKY